MTSPNCCPWNIFSLLNEVDWLRFAFEKHLPDLEIWAPISPSYNDNTKMAKRLSLEVQARLLKLGVFPHLSPQASGARPPIVREDVSSPPEKEMIKMLIEGHLDNLLPWVCEGPRLPIPFCREGEVKAWLDSLKSRPDAKLCSGCCRLFEEKKMRAISQLDFGKVDPNLEVLDKASQEEAVLGLLGVDPKINPSVQDIDGCKKRMKSLPACFAPVYFKEEPKASGEACGATGIDLESSNVSIAFFPPKNSAGKELTSLGEQAGGDNFLSSFKNNV